MNSVNSDRINSRAYIFLNGVFEKPLRDWPDLPNADDLVIAADGGARHAAALGWPIHHLIGDLDSIDQGLLRELETAGEIKITRYPGNKDEIDFELALNLARKKGYATIEVIAALGDRWDMTFGNLFLPRATGWGSDGIRFRQGRWTFWNVSGPASLTLAGAPGDLLSLLPMGEDVLETSLTGCQYPLSSETLRAGLSRGLSNVFLADSCQLQFASGTLIIMLREG